MDASLDLLSVPFRSKKATSGRVLVGDGGGEGFALTLGASFSMV